MKTKIKQIVHVVGFGIISMSMMIAAFGVFGDTTYASSSCPQGSSGTVNGVTCSGAKECGGVKTAIISCTESGGNDVQNSGILGILKLVVRVLAIGVGVVAVAGIGWGAIQYATAQDNAGQINEAISIIRNVIIGLVAFAFMTVFLNFIVPGGVL
ncbi:hypothetical protein GII36_00090 [Candidatus Mycosynbacter amalyticus]|uniref:Uncharacterized protein n=1 Tax=Candidatus Mycosynbacter amalyticus TaxID=2665156 RepID=A0A857MKJ1_9BACT|nr:hypothetical protein [Candidatus Mycosynbacter amalyticus]QHN42265.1 hypothetical protein GII36_00090 [Candidatus Mycosynbacter amalyticus]